MQATISALFVFPVKSLAGSRLDSATLTPTGLQWDRHWMIINAAGRFISQRQQPHMVLIKTRITATELILSARGKHDLKIPLRFSGNSQQPIAATIWKDQCSVVDEGQQASDWLSSALNSPTPVRLVRMADQQTRPQSQPQRLGRNTHTHFADVAPYVICNQQSLNALNQALCKQQQPPVTLWRFRPNIVIDGPHAFAEHRINSLQHKHYQLQHCYPCQRCIVTTIDTDTGTVHRQQQPFTTLATLNTLPDKPKAPAFGENAILTTGAQQTIRCGDRVRIAYYPESSTPLPESSTPLPESSTPMPESSTP
ncbi:MAG: MOSC N-terminal beta barrel domain-containing protein [Cellvibrionaceae bacterium]|nr:MOSC N-terminal beta barrel domain-containing protein [Cellvibrionaceae bacterium]